MTPLDVFVWALAVLGAVLALAVAVVLLLLLVGAALAFVGGFRRGQAKARVFSVTRAKR